MMRFTALAAAFAAAAANGPYPEDPTNVPDDFRCAWRSFAFEYAQKVNPGYDHRIVFDALRLGVLCNKTRPTSAPKRVSSAVGSPAGESQIYVATNGDDKNPGTKEKPLLTIAAGVAATRGLSAPKALLVGAGTYHLTETIELTSADSNLAIRAEAGAEGKVWVSGAQAFPSKLQWKEYNVTKGSNGTLTVDAGKNNQHGCVHDDTNRCGTCYNKTGAGASLDACVALCKQLGPDGCTSFAYSDSKQGTWSDQCCIRTDNAWSPSDQSGHTSGTWQGKRTAKNVWAAALPADFTFPKDAQLRLKDGDEIKRLYRARHPNADPETQQFPIGWVPTGGETWLPKKTPTMPLQPVLVNNSVLASRGSLSFNEYTGGIGGPCENFSPPFSYWCSASPQGGGGFQYYVPSGFKWADGTMPDGGKFASGAKDAVVHAWRRSHWSNWMFEVDSIDTAATEVHFGKGGFQGCRGGPGSDWFLENVLELLDTANEFYLDADAHMLYFQPNATGAPPADLDALVVTVQTLLSANASQASPITGLQISGIGFRDSAPTYLEPHGVPSGGDWALERMGALFFEGTEGLKITDCLFERLDGNGVMLSGYHRNAYLGRNEFMWTGGTAVAGWGRTDEISDGGVHGYDGTGGDFPWHTTLELNVMRETGIWEKQSSCWFQAKTAQTTLKHNLCFNLARAGFNFNDGFGGGDQVHDNLIFNSCRESADHGPINSWDRQPYVTTVATGKPSAKMLVRNITRNMLVGNYGGTNGAIDNDDGSLYYENNHNFLVYGHQKFKVGAIRSYGNVMAYVSDYGGKWHAPGDVLARPNAMFNNTVIFNPGDSQQYHDCTPWYAHDNHLYGPNIKITGQDCPKHGYSVAQWQAAAPKTHDVGTTVHTTIPSPEWIVGQARALLSK